MEDATIFSNLCSLQVSVYADTGNKMEYLGLCLMVDRIDAPYLGQVGLHYTNLQELKHLGLIHFSESGDYFKTISHANFPCVHIISDKTVITVRLNGDKFPIGYVGLTAAGASIARLIRKHYNQQHIESIRTYLEHNGMEISPTPGIKILAVEDGPNPRYQYQRI